MANWYDFIATVDAASMPVFDVKKFGAKGDGVTDDWAAFDAAIKAASPNADGGTTGVIANPFGGKVRVPVGRYYLSKPLDIVREIVLEGVSGAGREAPGSVLLFQANTVGIIVHRYNTAPLEDPLAPGGKFRQGRGDFSVIRDISLQSKERASGIPREAAAHGIHLHARALIENCFIKNFSGDGIHMNTDETLVNPRSGQPPVTDTNTDNWEIHNVRIEQCEGHGLYVKGLNSNAGRAIGLDASQNGLVGPPATGYGIYDDSFLGNTYVACHTAENQEGAFFSSGDVNRSLFLNCYSEAPQIVNFGILTNIVGGTFGNNQPVSGGQIIAAGVNGSLLQLRKTTNLAGTPVSSIGTPAFTVTQYGAVKIGGSLATAVAVKNSTNNGQTLNETESAILSDATTAAFQLKLPQIDASSLGRAYTIKKIEPATANTNNVTVTPFTGQLIEGQPSVILRNQWQSVTLVAANRAPADQTPQYIWVIVATQPGI